MLRHDHPRATPTAALHACAAAALALLLGGVGAAVPPALAQDHTAHDHHGAEQNATPQAASVAPSPGTPGVFEVGDVRFEIPDLEVLDQDGRTVRFYSDLVKDKVVVVSFFFTNCTFVCPVQGKALVKLQSALAARMGKEVFLISVSRDPLTDTPERLRSWASTVGVGPGWTLVTGGEEVMRKLLSKFTGDAPGREMHDPVLLIGNDRTGAWMEAEGLSATADLVQLIDQLASPSQMKTAGSGTPDGEDHEGVLLSRKAPPCPGLVQPLYD